MSKEHWEEILKSTNVEESWGILKSTLITTCHNAAERRMQAEENKKAYKYMKGENTRGKTIVEKVKLMVILKQLKY